MTPGFGDTEIAGVSGNTGLGVLGPNPAWSGRKRDRKCAPITLSRCFAAKGRRERNVI